MQESQSLLQIKPLDILVRCRISEMYHYSSDAICPMQYLIKSL